MEQEEAKKISAVPSPEDGPNFNEDLAAICKKHGIVSLFGAVQLDEAGSAGVVSFRADPWKRIGLSQLCSKIAYQALDKIKPPQE